MQPPQQRPTQPQPATAQQEVHAWERQAAAAEQPKNVRYSARFVKESFPDKQEVLCSEMFCKSWWMRNDGETSWPAGTQFLQTSGDNMEAKIVTLKNEVAAGATFEISVQFKAPSQEGRYTSFFRLQTGKIKFGHKVSCDVLCIKPDQVEEHEDLDSILIKNVENVKDIVQMVSQEPVAAQEAAAACDKEMGEGEAAVEEPKIEAPVDPFSQPSPLMQSTINIDQKSPKQLYFESVEALADQDSMKQALKDLYEFGFTNFQINHMLMKKHNDVNVVANQLMSGALSESQFGGL